MNKNKAIFCAFDTETTGLKENYNEVISFAGVLLDKDLKVINHLEAHAHPDHMDRFHPEAQRVNGYTQEEWDKKGATNQQVFQRKVQNFLTGYRHLYPIGHKISFDERFIRTLIGKEFYNRVFSYHKLDTISIALFCDLVAFQRPHNAYALKPLCQRFGIELSTAHDAKSDIVATVKLFEYLIKVGQGKKKLPEPSAPEESCFMIKTNDVNTEKEVFLFRNGKYKFTSVKDALEQDGKEAARYINDFVLRSTQLTPDARRYLEECLTTFRQNDV